MATKEDLFADLREQIRLHVADCREWSHLFKDYRFARADGREIEANRLLSAMERLGEVHSVRRPAIKRM